MTRPPNLNEYTHTTTVRLADGTLATLAAWWGAERAHGGYTLCGEDGCAIEARGDMGAAAWQDAMRARLSRREAGRGGGCMRG